MKRNIFCLVSLGVLCLLALPPCSGGDILKPVTDPLEEIVSDWITSFISAPLKANTAVKAAQEYARQGAYSDAEKRLLEAKDVIEHTNSYGPGCVQNCVLLYLLGKVQSRQEHYDLALPSFYRAMVIAKSKNLKYSQRQKIAVAARDAAAQSKLALPAIFDSFDLRQLAKRPLVVAGKHQVSTFDGTILPELPPTIGLKPTVSADDIVKQLPQLITPRARESASGTSGAADKLPDIREMVPVPLGKLSN